jgi:hypothetical protein
VTLRRISVLATFGWLAFPAVAGAETVLDVPKTVSMVTGVSSLLLSAMLLLVVVELRQVAGGSAIVDNIAYVVGGSLCLVAATLLSWLDRFLTDVPAGVVRAGADILLMFAVLFFAFYFSRVKRALTAFLAHLHSDDPLAGSSGADVQEDGVA